MIEWFFQILSFLTSNTGFLITGAMGALLILLWDWRFALSGVCFIQLSAATSAVVLHGVPAEWAFTQTVIVALVCLMLTLSARAHGLRPSIRQTGTWISRALFLGMFLAGAWFMDVQIGLPGMDALFMELLVWLVLCGFMLLGLSDHPLYNGAGMLLWLIPVQVAVAVVTPIPVIVAFVGLGVLLVGLAVSYLVFVEHMPADEGGPVLTDLTFPQQVKLESPPEAQTPPRPGPGLSDWIRRSLPRLGTWGETPPERDRDETAPEGGRAGAQENTEGNAGEPPQTPAAKPMLARRRP